MKFRKKPVVIEAMQFNGDNFNELFNWAHQGLPPEANSILVRDLRSINVRTMAGWLHAIPNDWIIKGIKGEFYPRKPDIFEATYEAVD